MDYMNHYQLIKQSAPIIHAAHTSANRSPITITPMKSVRNHQQQSLLNLKMLHQQSGFGVVNNSQLDNLSQSTRLIKKALGIEEVTVPKILKKQIKINKTTTMATTAKTCKSRDNLAYSITSQKAQDDMQRTAAVKTQQEGHLLIKKQQMLEFIRDKEFQSFISSEQNKSPSSLMDSNDYNRLVRNKAVALQNQLISQKIQEYDLSTQSPNLNHQDSADYFKRSVLSSRRATQFNNHYQNNVFLKGDLSELSQLNPVFQNHHATLKLNKKFSKFRYEKFDESIIKQVNQSLYSTNNHTQSNKAMKTKVTMKSAYNDLENKSFHQKSCRSRNNSQLDAEESYPIGTQTVTKLFGGKLRPRTAVFQRHNQIPKSVTPERSFSNNQQPAAAFETNTQFNSNLLGPNVKLKKSPKRKSLKEGKRKVEQKIKTVFNQVLKINKLTIQPVFNNIIINHTTAEPTNAFATEMNTKIVSGLYSQTSKSPLNQEEYKKGGVKHCLTRRAKRNTNVNNTTINPRSPRINKEFSRESSQDNIQLCQSARYLNNNFMLGDNTGVSSPRIILNKQSEKTFNNISMTSEVSPDPQFGKRGLYANKIGHHQRRGRILKLKQVQIKNMDLAGI